MTHDKSSAGRPHANLIARCKQLTLDASLAKRYPQIATTYTSLVYGAPVRVEPHRHPTLNALFAGFPKPFSTRIQFVDEMLYAGCWCTPNGSNTCGHPAMLALDVGLCEAMQAYLSGGPWSEVLRTLPEARAKWLGSQRIEEQLVDSWLSLGRESLSDPLEFSVEATRSVFDDTPSLLLFVRRVGAKSRLDPREVRALRLEEPLRGLVGLASDRGSTRKGWLFEGTAAAIMLHELRDYPLHLEMARRPLIRRETAYIEPRIAVRALTSADRDFDGGSAQWRAREGQEKSGERPTDHHVVLEWAMPNGDGLSAQNGVLFLGPNSVLLDSGNAKIWPIRAALDHEVLERFQSRRTVIALPSSLDPAAVYRALRRRTLGKGVQLPRPESLGLPTMEIPVISLRVDGATLAVRGQLVAEYASETVAIGAELPLDAEPHRDVELERRAFERLRQDGFVWSAELKCFAADDDLAARWWTTLIPAIRAGGEPTIALQIAAKLALAGVPRRARMRTRVSLAGSWFEVDAKFRVDESEINTADLLSALQGKRKYVALDDGTLAELTDEFRDGATEILALLDGKSHGKVSRFAMGRVDHLASRDDVHLDAAVAELRQKLRATEVAPEPRMPLALHADLREYQRAGLAWLQFLQQLQTGGVLADDMGLGKTVTALAFLQERKEREGYGPTLVIAPASVVSNWKREAERFTPDLRVEVLRGLSRGERMLEDTLTDVFVTSYGLLRQDRVSLAKRAFRTVIFDEAQFVKNAMSATAEAARMLQADMRLALTGTPVENHLGELWAILDLVNPSMLSTSRQFEQRYGKPIAAGDAQATRVLRAITRPFVLRRTKREVLQELPPKVEINRVVSLGRNQRALYDGMAAMLRSDVEKSVESKGVAASTLGVLTALLRLRQVSCDPRLVEPTHRAEDSAKRQAFLELVRELVAEGRRALVFSQFVSLLTLWRQDLDREGISYVYLDGSTTDREARVKSFQEGTAPLFLISLKAGGTGLNLTAADTVIHLDPWWNPAVEEQATDRAHRMGQTRSVTVYRLIAEGTVEEKIEVLKARKRELADSIVREDSSALRGLSEDDVRLLLSAASGISDEEPDLADSDEISDNSLPIATVPAELDDNALLAQRLAQTWLESSPKRTQKALATHLGVTTKVLTRLLKGAMPTVSEALLHAAQSLPAT
ncbi:MAG: DEAD/DEAH box helicase [Deltaproteobacteria bacterium]|nr:DEAD/DEAH box helicase [Deltaproteobacteria bacterium]